MQKNITGDHCIYFPVENLIHYITRHNPKDNTRSYEVSLGAILLRIYERASSNYEYLIGFPVLDKHIEKYKNKVLNDRDLALFIDKERKEATHVDVAIAILHNGEIVKTEFYQLKRFGHSEPYKNDDDLIALLSSLQNNPETGVSLLIHVMLAKITVSKAYLWLKGKNFPYDNVILYSAEPYGTRLIVGMIYVYPQRAVGTYGINLTPGLRPFGLIHDLYAALVINCRVAIHRTRSRLFYFLAKRLLLKDGFYN